MTVPPPPAWAVALLRRALPAEDRAAVLTDMEDLYRSRAERRGLGAARRWYGREAVRFAVVLARERTARGRERTLGLEGVRTMMRGLGTELARAWRRLLRTPVFTVVAVLTVGVGIGAFSSVYSVVDTVLLEPPPYRSPEDLMWIWRKYWFGLDRGWLAGPDVTNLRDHADVFSDVVAFRGGGATLAGRAGDHPRRVRVMLTSAGFLDLLGVDPALGRGFAPGDDAPGAPAVAVLGQELWRSHYGSDAGIVGRTIYLDGEPTTVLGVMPPDFRFVRHTSLGAPAPADLYMALRVDLAAEDVGSGAYSALARIRPGVPRTQVDAAIAASAKIVDYIWNNPGLEMWGVPLQEDLVGGVRPALLTLLAAAGFLVMILGANLATLLLGRALSRERELAVLSALGAGRGSIVRSLLAESMVLSGVGAALGIALAVLGTHGIRALAPTDLPRRLDVAVDPSVVAMALAGGLLMALASGCLPALRWLRPDVARRLREGAGRAGKARGATRARSGLVVLQVGMSLVLLASAGLLTQAFVHLLRADPGFDARPALTFQLSLDEARYPDAVAISDFDTRLRQALGSLPGVESVGAVDALPLSTEGSQTNLAFPDAPGNQGDGELDRPLADYFFAGPGYDKALGMRLLEGEWLSASDPDSPSPPAMVIDDILAERFFPAGSAVGAQALYLGREWRVVGVVDHVRHYTMARDGRPQVYLPLTEASSGDMAYVLAVTADPGRYAVDVRQRLDALDPEIPLYDVSTVAGLIRESLGQERLSLHLLLAFAAGALLLAALGVYGVVAHGVTQRTHEMGVRIALGAGRRRVVLLVLGQGLRLAAWGTLLGLAGSLASARVLGSVVVGVEPRDPVVLGVAALGLVALATLAAYIPAYRATRIDPLEALKGE